MTKRRAMTIPKAEYDRLRRVEDAARWLLSINWGSPDAPRGTALWEDLQSLALALGSEAEESQP